jgi:hypothetical protein
VVERVGGWCFTRQEVEALADRIDRLVYGGEQPRIDRTYADSFEVANTTRRLLSVFEEVLG